jgi:phosphoglycerate dehydrogenase-like enzyme
LPESRRPVRILVSSPVSRESLDQRLRQIGGVEPAWVQASELPAVAADADAIVLSGLDYTSELAQALRAPASRCRWLQLLSAGYERLLEHGVPAGVQVSNAGSVWSAIVAEHTMALLLAHARRLPRVLAAQGRSEWDNTIRRDTGMLLGGRLVIVGMGSIGGEVARRARAFGMSVVGVSRSGRVHPDADQSLPISRLHEALRQADVVVVAVPLSPETTGLIDAGALAACPPHAVIANVARGPVIDQAALVQALETGAIGGAVLDVTDPEPLPADSPLWRLPNVIVSPHIGGAAPERYYERLVEHVVTNTGAWARGEPLRDRIEVSTQ